MSKQREAVFGCILVFAIGALWLPWLGESLWLDEAVTYWVVSAGFGDAVSRAVEFQYSGAYFALQWVAVHGALGPLASMPEWAFRLPSLLCVLAATAVVYRAGVRLYDGEGAWLAAIAFAVQSATASAASDARPYGLGLLAVTGALALTLRWLRDGGRARDGSLAVGLGCLALYTQPLLGLVLPVQALAALAGARAGWVSGRSLAIVAGVGLAALAPAAPVFQALLRGGGALLWAPEPSVWDAVRIVVVPLGLFGFIRWSAASLGTADAPASPRGLAVVLLWCTLPPLVLYAVSVATDAHVLLPHYASSAVPALSLLVAGFVRSLPSAPLRLAVAAALVLASVLAVPDRALEFADWREDAATLGRLELSEGTPVLFHSGLVEGSKVAWLRDPDRRAYLMAPSLPYLVDRAEGATRLIPLPYDLSTPEQVGYLEAVYERELAGAERFVVTGRFPSLFRAWLVRRARHFEATPAGASLVFERRRPVAPGAGVPTVPR